MGEAEVVVEEGRGEGRGGRTIVSLQVKIYFLAIPFFFSLPFPRFFALACRFDKRFC